MLNTAAASPSTGEDSAESVAVWTEQNGAPARELKVRTQARAKRPNPGHFGVIEPKDAEQVLKPLYPKMPDFA